MNTFALIKNVLLNLFDVTLRGTGRSRDVVDKASDGSLIIVLRNSEIRATTAYAKEQGKSVIVIADETGDLYNVAERIRGNRYTSIHFDHRWLELFIFNRINHTEQSINHFVQDFTERK